MTAILAEAGLDAFALAVAFAAFFVGAFVKGALGFGMPLITMAIVPLVAPVDLALALNAIVAGTLNVTQTLEGGRALPAIRRFWPAVVALGPGVAVGALLVSVVDDATLRLLLGVTVLGFVGLTVTGAALAIPPHRERAAGVVTGLVGGVVGGLTTANGPVLLMYVVGLGLDRGMFRAALGLLFLATALFAGAGFVAVGVIDAPRAAAALICLVPAALGNWAGNRAGRRLNQRLFRGAVLAGLTVIGLNYVARATGAI